MDLIGTAGEDDCHAVVNVVSIISNCYLADSDPYWRLSKSGALRGIFMLAFNIENRVLWPSWELARRVSQVSDSHSCHIV